MIRKSIVIMAMAAACALLAPAGARAKDEPLPPQFKYWGGTEDLAEGCEGNLEINPDVVTFRCWGGKIDVPYAAIQAMEYRSEVSSRVRKMKVKWKVRPASVNAILKAKKNRFFTVVYTVDQAPHVMVLRVEPRAMRPYLAELDLRSEKRVEVESYEDD
jgi:hypothetical protein